MKFPVTQRFWTWFTRPLLLVGLLLTIPAFYLVLGGATDMTELAGRSLYAASALLMLVDTGLQWQKNRSQKRRSGKLILDGVIIAGCLLSVIFSGEAWSTLEWLLRLALVAVILLRLATLVLQHMKPSHLVQMIGLALLMLSSAGAGFYWLEPNVHSYANGVWLAF
ncbi:MAG: two pore domain potassium channel family protein, partial [Burkholderiales bacterium]|nr:two pore domain potassium channel family protein [Burkholderiales bacterium]